MKRLFVLLFALLAFGASADTWDKTTPTGSTPFPSVDDAIRTNQSALEERYSAEHQFPSNPFTSHTSGRHKFGVGTTATRDATLTSPASGMVWYNTSLGAWQVHNGTNWLSAGSTGVGTTAARNALTSVPTNFSWLSTDEGFTSYYNGTAWITLSPKGLFHGRISYATASTVTLGRGNQAKLRVEVDGVMLESSSDITIDLASADREDTSGSGGSASETASTWYYLYVYNNSNAIGEKISFTPPVMDPASGKVGYHPGTGAGSTGWRCIGAVFNNASSNIQPFDFDTRSGLWQFRSLVSAFTKSPGLGQQASYATVALTGNVPATARMARLVATVQQEDSRYYYGHESLSGTVSTTPSVHRILLDLESNNNNPTGTLEFDVAVDSTPAFAWGNVMVTVESADEHNVDVVGWFDDLGLVN